MGMGLIVLLVILAIVVVAALWFVSTYNGLIKMRNLVQEAWAQIDVELKRRHDLIGNLVETVKGYASHERGTLEEITRARAAAMTPGQSPGQAAQSEAALSQALVRLNAVAEAYPDLKANQNFAALQQELSSTEDRIASARRYYNANVREMNTKVETVPTNLVAGMAGVKQAEYFEVGEAERQAPRVSFDQGSQAPGYPPVSGPGQSGPWSATPATPQDAPPPGPQHPSATPPGQQPPR